MVKRASYSLNKGTLAKKKKELAAYMRYLPALELKQQQLMAVHKNERENLQQSQNALSELEQIVRKQIPMLASDHFSLDGLVQLDDWRTGEEFVVGVALPFIDCITVRHQEYGLLARPHWVDRFVDLQEQAIRLIVNIDVQRQRVEILSKAATTATQRVNLFSKILVPETNSAIKKIQVYVSDSEAAAVVRSKITKKKTAVIQNDRVGLAYGDR